MARARTADATTTKLEKMEGTKSALATTTTAAPASPSAPGDALPPALPFGGARGAGRWGGAAPPLKR